MKIGNLRKWEFYLILLYSLEILFVVYNAKNNDVYLLANNLND